VLPGYTNMVHNNREPHSGVRYIARRVWQRLLLALYANRITVAVAIVILIALGLFSLRGAPRGEAAVVGVMPIAVSVQQLEPRGETLPLVLKEKSGSRYLSLPLESAEARVIAREQGVRVPGGQPRAYDLMRDIIQQLGGRVDHVILADADRGGYAASIMISVAGETRMLRAKPADAVALALKAGGHHLR
jgi:bifunctional DNase/RNase